MIGFNALMTWASISTTHLSPSTHKDTNMPRIHEMIESKFLKKEEVGEDGTVATIASIQQENVAPDDKPKEMKWTMSFNEFEKPLVMNTTNLKMCDQVLGSDDTDEWIGRQVIVYNDPTIQYAGQITGGIRIRAFRKAAPPREIPAAAARRAPVDDSVARRVASQGVPGASDADLKDDIPF